MIGFLLLWGCGEKEQDSTSIDTGSEPIDCSTLSANECSETNDCVGINANQLEVDDVNTCYEIGEQSMVGCMSANMGCGDAITFATDSGGTPYWFSSTCIPEGWSEQTELNSYSEGCSQPNIDCYSLSVSECGSEESCTLISGFERIEDTTEECYRLSDMTSVGCMPANEACEPVVVNMQDPSSGSCFQINHGCTPTGWSVCEGINDEWPECPQQ